MHLKRVFWIVILFALTQNSYSYEKMTLTSNGLKNGGFVGAALKISQLDDAWFAMAGFRMAWVINEHFTFGGAYYDMTEMFTHFDLYVPQEAQPAGEERHLLKTNYAGMELGYIFAPERVVFISLYNLMGIGHLQYVEPKFLAATRDDRYIFTEPSVDINLNLSDHIKITTSAGYRLVSGVRATGMSNQDLSGLTLTASVILGSF